MTENMDRRRWLQYSLRTLLVVCTCAALVAAWLRERQQQVSLGRLERERDELARLVDKQTPEADEPSDGLIVAVNPKEDVVWINVGRVDNLRSAITFAVFPRGDLRFPEGKRKGMIKVTRFLGHSMAEARIVKSELKNPIRSGDIIHSAHWSPGETERYVIAGEFFNVRGDKTQDQDTMVEFIALNGGVVERGLSPRTRYLLLGARPANSNAAMRYDWFREAAKKLNIGILTLSDFGVNPPSPPLTWNPSDILEVLNRREGTRRSGFKFRSAPEGARRLEPGAKPGVTPTQTEPSRRPGPQVAPSR